MIGPLEIATPAIAPLTTIDFLASAAATPATADPRKIALWTEVLCRELWRAESARDLENLTFVIAEPETITHAVLGTAAMTRHTILAMNRLETAIRLITTVTDETAIREIVIPETVALTIAVLTMTKPETVALTIAVLTMTKPETVALTTAVLTMTKPETVALTTAVLTMTKPETVALTIAVLTTVVQRIRRREAVEAATTQKPETVVLCRLLTPETPAAANMAANMAANRAANKQPVLMNPKHLKWLSILQSVSAALASRREWALSLRRVWTMPPRRRST
jgi:hypothetical protein